MTTQLLADLRKLAELLEPDGAWCQNRDRESGKHSLRSAIIEVTGGAIRPRIEINRALKISGRTLGEDTHLLIEWEHAPNRTQAEVKALIAAAIERAGGAG